MKRILFLMLAILMVCGTVACQKQEETTRFADLSIRGTVLTLGAEAPAALAALGEYRAVAETGSCYGDGLDRVYEYDSFKVKTYTDRDKEYILSVEIFSDADASIATPEGVAIGASRESVEALYDAAHETSDAKLVYLRASDNVKLQFLIRDGKVTNIQYLKAENN